MICKKTWLNIADNTNVRWIQVFHLYKGFYRRVSSIGFFVKGSARIVEPPRIEYKGFKFKFNKKGDICRSILIRTRKSFCKVDGTTVLFNSNEGLLIRKKQDLKSKYIFGPVTTGLKRRKFKSLFKVIL
jgi:large subunit ribosomal protein L14